MITKQQEEWTTDEHNHMDQQWTSQKSEKSKNGDMC